MRKLLLLFIPSIAFSFNADYESVSSLDESGRYITSRTLANLPYSACRADSPVLSDANCNIVSLRFGSTIFNSLFYNNAIIKGLDYSQLNSSTAEALSSNYFVASQDNSIKWNIPTVPQLEWMAKNNLITPKRGEYFWAMKNGMLKRVFYEADGSSQGGSYASIQRLANNKTPSTCTDGVDCTLFGELKPYFIRVYRGSKLHSMGYTIRYILNGTSRSFTDWTDTSITYTIPIGAHSLNFTYCIQNTFNCGHSANLPPVNFSYNTPTICVKSEGSMVNTRVYIRQVEAPWAC